MRKAPFQCFSNRQGGPSQIPGSAAAPKMMMTFRCGVLLRCYLGRAEKGMCIQAPERLGGGAWLMECTIADRAYATILARIWRTPSCHVPHVQACEAEGLHMRHTHHEHKH